MEPATTPPADLDVDAAAVHDEYARRGYAGLTDEQLFEHAARVVARPKQDPADSFRLHAPLELLARRALLRFVPPDRREPARERMLWVAAKYERYVPDASPGPAVDFASPAAARAALVRAIADRDLGAADAATMWLGREATTDDVMLLADPLLDSLAAAGHGAIYFHLLARSAGSSRAALGLLRPLVREIARLPELRIEWVAHLAAPSGTEPVGAGDLARALATTPRLGLPGSDFIFPIVHQVDAGVARAVVAPSLPADTSAAAQAVMRVAATSMLQDDRTYAPYGWSHCLTLPQAALGITPWIADARRAAAIAATYVVAFRSSQGSRDVDVDWEPEPTAVALPDALHADPPVAASATYHAPDAALDATVPALAARAAVHEDAHLAKYTLACLDAAARDHGARRLYLAAAASLGAWWADGV